MNRPRQDSNGHDQSGPDPSSKARDEGSALILALVLILVGTLMVLPVMQYTMTVTRANRTSSTVADRTEAVKGGLRTALYDPIALYQACEPSKTGPSVRVNLAVPPGLGIATWCTSTGTASINQPDEQRYALTTTQVGSGALIPPPHSGEIERPELNGTVSQLWCTSMAPPDNDPFKKIPCGKPSPYNDSAVPTDWQAYRSSATATDTIFWPWLPPFSNNTPSASGYDMPVGPGIGPCKVFFPGKYIDDVVLTGSVPYYFVSGIYYFEKTFRVTGGADVVVGSGSTPGCVESDSVAVLDAINAPFDSYSSGVGGTFVFGANGRLVVDTATAGTTSLKFNRRLVEKTDDLAVLNDVSITSVTGILPAVPVPSSTTAPVVLPYLDVPVTRVLNRIDPLDDDDPWEHRYRASNLISTETPPVSCAPPAALSASCPIIDLNFTTNASVTVNIPGYVSIAQGSLSISTAAGAGANKTVSFGGGILAAQVYIPPAPAEVPVSLQMGLLNPVVQLTLKITTETTGGNPKVTSVAHVQVNETGGYAVNSWVVQANCGTEC